MRSRTAAQSNTSDEHNARAAEPLPRDVHDKKKMKRRKMGSFFQPAVVLWLVALPAASILLLLLVWMRQPAARQQLPWMTDNLVQYDEQDDSPIDPDNERERCARYGYSYKGRTTRRRIFLGSLIANDSWLTIHTLAAELYNICHTVAFVESNQTFRLTPRELRFTPGSDNMRKLTSLFGPDSSVHVDNFVFDPDEIPKQGVEQKLYSDEESYLLPEQLAREHMLKRWKQNGMLPEDIGILSDTDEIFTRDFLRAMQVCDIPQFRPGQSCHDAKISGFGIIMETSPECVYWFGNRAWAQPSAVIGECIHHIGNVTRHRPPKRVHKGVHGWRAPGHGGGGMEDYGDYFAAANQNVSSDKRMYPLFNGADYRRVWCNVQPHLKGKDTKDMLHTAFHLHNFFETTDEIRHKYKTYGHPIADANNVPLKKVHHDLDFAIKCAKNVEPSASFPRIGFRDIVGPKPLYFQNAAVRQARHDQWKQLVKDAEHL